MVLTNFSGGVSSANTKARGAVHAAIASAATQKKCRWYERINPSPFKPDRFQCNRKQRRRCLTCFDQFSSIEGTSPLEHLVSVYSVLPRNFCNARTCSIVN